MTNPKVGGYIWPVQISCANYQQLSVAEILPPDA